MAPRPNPVIALALLAAAGASTHASLGLLINFDVPEIAYGYMALAAGLALAGGSLFFAPHAIALLLHWIALGAATIGLVWAATSSYEAPSPDPLFYVLGLFGIALGWNTWYALQWWLGGNPTRFLQRMGIGYFAAAVLNIVFMPLEIADDIYLFLVDDAVSAVAFALAGFFLVRYSHEAAPASQRPAPSGKPQ